MAVSRRQLVKLLYNLATAVRFLAILKYRYYARRELLLEQKVPDPVSMRQFRCEKTILSQLYSLGTLHLG